MLCNKINQINIPDGSEYSLASVDNDLYIPNNILMYDPNKIQIRHIQSFSVCCAICDKH